MQTCVFKTAEVRRCIEHALNSKNWKMGWSSEDPAPALFFVHDEGVYLMSNGEPGDPKSRSEIGLYAAYAEGCDPDLNPDDWWDTSRVLVGGDDFAEVIPVTAEELLSCDEFEELHVIITAEKFGAEFCKPRKKALSV